MSAIYTRESYPYHASTEFPEFDQLERKACLCKTATKVANCICLPLSCFCCILNEMCEKQDEVSKRVHPETRREYSTWTSCDGGESCSASRLPPESKCDLIMQIFDPWFFCLCCIKENSANYLLPQDQRKWRQLGPIKQSMVEADAQARGVQPPHFPNWEAPPVEVIPAKNPFASVLRHLNQPIGRAGPR